MFQQWNKLTLNQRTNRIKEQQNIEDSLFKSGIEKYWREWERMPDEGKPEQRLIGKAVAHLTESYQKWIDNTVQNKKSPDWLAPLLDIGATKMADITIRNIVRVFLTRNNISSPSFESNGIPKNAPTAQQIAKLISEDIVSIISFRKAKEDNYQDWKKQSKFIKNWTPKRCRAFTLKMGKNSKLTFKQKEDLGHNMLRIAMSSDIVESKIIFTKEKKKILLVFFSPWIMNALSKQHTFLESMSVVFRPMVCAPVQHNSTEDGGFLSTQLRKRIVKRYTPTGGDKNKKAKRPPDIILQGLNSLMNTEWAINKPVYDVMKFFFENDSKIANLPAFSCKDYAFSRSFPKEGTKEEKAKWMRESNEAWGEWFKEEQSRSRMLVRLVLAEKMHKYGFFYMPYTCDFRGRSYTVCELLSCQGMDFDRALIYFASSMPQTERGIYWLKIHIANLFDQDKNSFEERIAWVDNNLQVLSAIHADPYSDLRWVDNKKKKNTSFQRLAAIFELFRTDGKTQLQIQMDGVNNGVQHWSAIMADKKLAELTNLLPSDKPVDFYQTIADETSCFIRNNQTLNTWFPKFLVHWGGSIKRNVTKRSTMCDAYGLTFYGMQKYIKEEGHVDWVPKEERGGAIVELAKAIKGGLGQTMENPNKGKDWLRAVAEIFNEIDKPLCWTTPTGFEVYHIYNKMQERVSYAQLFNKQSLTFVSVANEMNPRAQYLGISPNWIHSLDAAHQFLTIAKMAQSGIESFSFIHDSYGTHATNIDTMNRFTREEFIKIHKENQLEKLKKELEDRFEVSLPPVPQGGEGFDLTKVKESTYFFS